MLVAVFMVVVVDDDRADTIGVDLIKMVGVKFDVGIAVPVQACVGVKVTAGVFVDVFVKGIVTKEIIELCGTGVLD